MLSTAIVIFREMVEIAMILGVVLAATRHVPGRALWVFGGLAAGLAGAGLVAVFAQAISNAMSGMGQEFFNAMILFTAALFIGWTVVWMRIHARDVAMHLKHVGHQVTDGTLPHYSLSVIIGLAILREGSEIVLFIYGMTLSGQSTASIVAGSVTGVVLGTITGVLFYYGLLKIPTKYALTVTSWLLMLLVAGLASQGSSYLLAAGYFSDLSHQVWDSSWLLSEDGILGKSLHTLIGYTARPSVLQVMVYVATLLGLLAAIKWLDRRHKKTLALAFALLAFGVHSHPAYALDEIYSPIAEPGELSLEYNGSRTFDHNSAKNNDQEHEIALEYGIADRIVTEVSGGFAKEPDGALRMEDVELEGRWQFFEQGKYWLDTGMLAAYDFSTQSQTPDSLELKLLLQKDIGRVTSTANIGFDQNMGEYSAHTGGPDYVLLWNTRYRYNEYFEPGIELQSDFGQGHTLGHFSEQEHYIGPAVYGKLFGALKYQAAWLAGMSTASSQSAARLLVEYEMHF